MEDIFKGVGIEIQLVDKENFLKIKETLTRIGVASKKENKLFQSCHILHKRGRYAILHFKELFILDGKNDILSEEDKARRNTIANLLEEWNLVRIESTIDGDFAPLNQIKIISHKEKDNWVLCSKYNIGKKQYKG